MRQGRAGRADSELWAWWSVISLKAENRSNGDLGWSCQTEHGFGLRTLRASDLQAEGFLLPPSGRVGFVLTHVHTYRLLQLAQEKR